MPARAVATDDTGARILELESVGRARPREAADALERLLPQTAQYGDERLELLTVQGLMLALAGQTAAADAASMKLAAWGDTSSAPSAKNAMAASLLVNACATAVGGSLQKGGMLTEQALAELPASASPRDRYRFVMMRAFAVQESGQIEAAVRLGHEALSLADQTATLWREAEARTRLAYSYCDAKQCERGMKLVTEAIALAETAQDWISLARAHSTAGSILGRMGDTKGEGRSFEMATRFARRAGSKIDEVLFLANTADFYLKTSNYKSALADAEKALPLAREIGDSRAEMVALANIGLAHIAMHRLDIGKRYVRESIAIDERRGSVRGVSDSLRELGVYLERAGDIPGAIAAYHKHRKLAIGALHEDQQKAVLEMQEQYDADSRSRALALLERESAIQTEQLKHRDLQQRRWYMVAIVVLSSFAVVTWLYRSVRASNVRVARSNSLLKAQSELDPLTGLANRRCFHAAMNDIAADDRLRGGIYMIDIDHFKSINDRYGHGAGDAVLVEVAGRLRASTREQDLVVRWGGEEFLVIARSRSLEEVEALAQRVLNVIDSATVMVEGNAIAVTASIGFAALPIGRAAVSVSWQRAIALVDNAMYLAKSNGRNRAYGVRILGDGDETSLDDISNALESACRDGRIALTLLKGRASLAPAVC